MKLRCQYIILMLDNNEIYRKYLFDFIVDEFYQHELARKAVLPEDMQRVRTLKDRVQYACRTFQIDGDQPSQSQSGNAAASRKRSNEAINQSDYESDSTELSCLSPEATNEQDLPGYKRPPSKRRKMFDPGMIIPSNRYLVDVKSEMVVVKTPNIAPQESTSSRYLQKSATKMERSIHGQMLSDSVMAHDFPELLAQSINNAFDNTELSSAQLEQKLSNIISTAEQYPNFDDIQDDIIHEFCPESVEGQSLNSSSSTSSKPTMPEDDSIGLVADRQLDTPVPGESTRRYELRSNRKSTQLFNTSAEAKRKKNAKANIISDERITVSLPESELQALRDEPIVVESDSEGTVTTTSQQTQQPTCVLVVGSDGRYYLVPQQQLQQQSTTSSSAQANDANVIHQSQFIITPSDQTSTEIVDLEDYVLTDPIAIQSGEVVISTMEDVRSRLIEIDSSDVNKEGSQPVQEYQQAPEIPSSSKKSDEKNRTELPKEKPNLFAGLNQIGDQKIVTPKHMIKSSIPSTSRSLSTPRNKNPVVRVLDYNTPNHFHKLIGIAENRSGLNTSRFLSETPQNRSITSSMPSSAPPKISSVTQSGKVSIEKGVESSTDVFNPTDENTVVSADGETPKVRKTNRKSCVRTISAHKEINAEENERRLKRVAKTKKKICPEDGDSNESQASNKKSDAPPKSKEDALAEWQKIRSANTNPELFEQNLREQNSKKQEIELSTTGRKRRSRRSKKKSIGKGKQMAKNILDESTKTVDMSMNSSMDVDALNSTQTNLEARMLEENLKSVKKATPTKQMILLKSAKKKTPLAKLQIKLMPSPKNKALKRQKSAKKLSASNSTGNEAKKMEEQSTSSIPVIHVEEPQPVTESDANGKQLIMASENTNDDLEVAQNLIQMKEVILQQENERKKAQRTEIQSDSVSMSEQAMEVPVVQSNSGPVCRDVLLNLYQPNLSLSALLDTPFKDNALFLPRTPGLNAILPNLTTP